MIETENIIRAAGLTKHYRVGGGVVRALDGVDLGVARGEFVCITGRSGSGKSTLLSLLAGLETPTEGTVEICGGHIERMDEKARVRFRRKNIGFVFQSYNLMPQYTTLENVALPLAVRGVPPKRRRELAEEALLKVGLSGHLSHRPGELSGGEQQRVGIARAIITGPTIVLADEPTGNLDSATGERVMELLCELFRREKTTFLLVTHNREMERYANRTVCLGDGKICKTTLEGEIK